MPLENHWQHEMKISEHIPLSHMIEPTVFETKQGDIGSVIEFEGYDFETANLDTLNYHKKLHQHVISDLTEHISLTYYTIRRHHHTALTDQFDNAFCAQVNRDYHNQFQDQPFYSNTLYVVIMHKGPAIKKNRFHFFNHISYDGIAKARHAFRLHIIKTLKKITKQFINVLHAFKPKLLGEKNHQDEFSEILSLFGFLISGQWQHYRACHPKSMESTSFHYPKSNLSQAISNCRLFFGHCIQIGENKPKFANIVAMKSYASKTHPLILEKLLHLPIEMVICHHFLVEKNDNALKKIERTLYKYDVTENQAVSLMQELKICQDDLASDRLIAGYHQHTVMLFGHSVDALDQHIDALHAVYNEAGFRLSHSALAIEPLFWSQFAGNKNFLTHLSLITSENWVDFCPLFNYASKADHHTHLKSPITLIKTASQTALPFHYHASSSNQTQDMTPGHTTIIGGTGSGKTVLLGFMDTQSSRFQGRSFFFDRDRGMEVYIRVANGRYFRLNGEKNKAAIHLNPLQLPDSKTNRDFLKIWLGTLILLDHETNLPADLVMWISECIDFVYDEIQPHLRTLSVAAMRLPLEFSRKAQLNQWLKGDHQRSDGPYAWLFDNACDELNIEHHTKIGFDLTVLMQQPATVLMATCLYLMHRIKLTLDGCLTSIVFDEGWQILDHPFWKNQLKKDLPTLRKLNTYIILSTQSPASVVQSALSSHILDNCSTQIFFCNPMANETDYQHFQLTEYEFNFIKNTPKEKRFWLYKQDQCSVIAHLPLNHMPAALSIWSAKQNTLKTMDYFINQVGDDVQQWLPLWLKSQALHFEGFS